MPGWTTQRIFRSRSEQLTRGTGELTILGLMVKFPISIFNISSNLGWTIFYLFHSRGKTVAVLDLVCDACMGRKGPRIFLMCHSAKDDATYLSLTGLIGELFAS